MVFVLLMKYVTAIDNHVFFHTMHVWKKKGGGRKNGEQIHHHHNTCKTKNPVLKG